MDIYKLNLLNYDVHSFLTGINSCVSLIQLCLLFLSVFLASTNHYWGLGGLGFNSRPVEIDAELPNDQRKENSSSTCRHPLQDLTHLLDCPASEPLRRAIFGTTSSIFDLWSQTLGRGSTVGSSWSSSTPPSLRRGRVAPPLRRLLC